MPLIRLSILATEFAVRSWKSWNVSVPEKAGSLAPLEACETPIVQNWPEAIVTATPPLVLPVETV